MATPKTPAERELKTRIERCQRIATRRGQKVAKLEARDRNAIVQGVYVLTDGKRASTFEDIAEVEERLGIKPRKR